MLINPPFLFKPPFFPTLGILELRVYKHDVTGTEAVALVCRMRHIEAAILASNDVAVGSRDNVNSTSGAVNTAAVRSAAALIPRGSMVLRVQDACVTSEVFGSIKCDCRAQLDLSMALLFELAVRAGGDLEKERGHASGSGVGSSSGNNGILLREEDIVIGNSEKMITTPIDQNENKASVALLPSVSLSSLTTSAEPKMLPLPTLLTATSSSSSSSSDLSDSSTILGIVIYLLQEGRGVGLAAKVAAYALQETHGGGLDTVDANRALGLPDDAREYGAVADVLSDLAFHQDIYLLSNNPRKQEALEALSVQIAGRVPCVVRPMGSLARGYLRAKAERMGHLIPREAFVEEDYEGER